MDAFSLIGLTNEGCQDRQHILREYLRSLKLDAALLLDRRHVHYLTGYWTRSVFVPAVLVERDGPTTIVVPADAPTPPAADEVRKSESAIFCTLVDGQREASLAAIQDRLSVCGRIGTDTALFASAVPSERLVDLTPTLFSMRRCKDEDELQFLRKIVEATETVYARARETLAAGVTEVAWWAELLRTASELVGETLGEFGNDFQIGGIGSPPRRRAAEAGETAILDLGLVVRGYHGDMCRTFVVGGSPSEAQLRAQDRIQQTLEAVERMARPGTSCRSLYETAYEMLEGYEGWNFFHHLGHGVGLNGHEAPRLHPRSEDRLQVGDVFTMEPGLYGPELRAGVRLEQMYHVGEKGIERLSSFPLDL